MNEFQKKVNDEYNKLKVELPEDLSEDEDEENYILGEAIRLAMKGT